MRCEVDLNSDLWQRSERGALEWAHRMRRLMSVVSA